MKRYLSKQLIVMRCIADRQKGYGNLVRCITLAKELRKKKYQILFLIDDEKQASKILVKQKFSHKIIPKEESREQADRIAKIMNFFSSRILLLDMREYGE